MNKRCFQAAVGRCIKSFLVSACVMAASTVLADTLPTHNNNFPVTDGAVYSSAATETALYVGGSFNLVGPYTGGGVPILQGAGGIIAYPEYPQINGKVTASIPDGNGGWYIAGEFENIGGVLGFHGLAHINADGTLDYDWTPNPGNNVKINAMFIDEQGGLFIAGSKNANIYIATINLETLELTDWELVDDGEIYAMAPSFTKGKFYVGGAFNDVYDGTARNNILAVNMITTPPSLDGFNPDADGTVYALALSSDEETLYVGGEFTEIDSGAIQYVAALDTSDGSVIAGFDAKANDHVHALALSSDDATLYVGGEFTEIGANSATRNGLAAIDTATGNATDFEQHLGGGNGAGLVDALALSADDAILYAGGNFTMRFDELAPRYGLAVFDTTGQGTLLESGSLAANAIVRTISAGNGVTAFVGGDFGSLACEHHGGIAAIDIVTGGLLAGWAPHTINGNFATVHKLLVSPDGNTLYVGGYFQSINIIGDEQVVERRHIAAIDLATGEITDFDQSLDQHGAVLDMIFSPDAETLYIGGSFNEIGEDQIPRNNIAAFNLNDGSLVEDFDPDVGGPVCTLAISENGDVLYFGGYFTTVNTVGRNYIAAVNTDDGALNNDFNPGADTAVRALALSSDGMLYVGGDFAQIAGADQSYIAKLDAGNGIFIGDFAPFADDKVFSLALTPGEETLLVGGVFSMMSGVNSFLAALDPTDGSALLWDAGIDFLDDTFAENFSFSFTPDGSALFVGGAFKSIAGFSNRRYISRFDLAPTLLLLGSDDKPLVDSMEPTAESGTLFSSSLLDGPVSNKFTLVNHSALQLTLLDIEFDDEDAPFSVPGMPESVPPYSSASFHVVFAPENDDLHAVAMTITSDAARNQFVVNLAGSAVKADQTITFPAIPEQSVTSVVTLAATASSGLSVTFTVAAGPGVISDDTSLSFTGTGTVAVVAAQAGNAIWNAAAPVTNRVIVRGEETPEPPPAATGTFKVSVSPAHGTWTVNPPANYNGLRGGTGDYTLSNAPTGVYVVSFGSIKGYRTPASQTGELAGGETVLFHGVYTKRSMPADFGGADASTLALYDPNLGLWYAMTAEGELIFFGEQWGGPGLYPVLGDYNGDGESDLALYDEANGLWYIRTLAGEVLGWEEQWGAPGFTPVPGDYDGDGLWDLCVYHEATGLWYARTLEGEIIAWAEAWGGPGFTPVMGDYDGDGKADLCVYCDAVGFWYALTLEGEVLGWEEAWGGPGHMPVPGDYDGDGEADLCVYDTVNGLWYIRTLAGDELCWAEAWGGPGYMPVPGDYDGDGISDLCVYNESTGFWYARTMDGEVIAWETGFGGPGLIPAAR